jgi:hypothetical protein
VTAPFDTAGDKAQLHPTPQVFERYTESAGEIAWVDEPVATRITIKAHLKYPSSQGGSGCRLSAILPHG